MLGMQKFLKKNWKQVNEAADNYLNGVSVSNKNMINAIDFAENLEKQGIQGDALVAAVNAASSDIKQGAAGVNAIMRDGQFQNRGQARSMINNLSKMGKDTFHLHKMDDVNNFREARGYTTTSDLQAAGAIAAAGVIGFSAVAGAANLVRGED